MSDANDILAFCPRCFASNEDGSWGHTAVPELDFCTNCCHGGLVRLPRWAIKSIRVQASWVGKRYYPNEEDHERAEEVRYLRSQMPDAPGRSVEPCATGEPDAWTVRQKKPDGREISLLTQAPSAAAALAKTKTDLPYYPKESLEKQE